MQPPDPGEPPRALGCARCRYSKSGCTRCRSNTFQPRSSSSRKSSSSAAAAAADGRRSKAARRTTAALASQPPNTAAQPASDAMAQPVLPHKRQQQQDQRPDGVVGAGTDAAVTKRRRPQASPSTTGLVGHPPAAAVVTAQIQQQQQQQQQQHVMGLAPSVPSPPPQPAPADFMQLLQQRMQVVHQAREHQQSQGATTTPPLSPLLTPPKRRTQSAAAGATKAGRQTDSSGKGGTVGSGSDSEDSPTTCQLLAAAASPSSPAASPPSPPQQQAPLGGAKPRVKQRRGDPGASPLAGSSKKARKPGPCAHLHAAGDPDPRLSTWEPPVSPFGLIEEELYHDPWKLLLACMLLNKTSGKQVLAGVLVPGRACSGGACCSKHAALSTRTLTARHPPQVRQVIWDLFAMCPTPQAAVAADQAAIRELIRPLGLFNKRAAAVQRFSEEYVDKRVSGCMCYARLPPRLHQRSQRCSGSAPGGVWPAANRAHPKSPFSPSPPLSLHTLRSGSALPSCMALGSTPLMRITCSAGASGARWSRMTRT